MKEFDYKSKDPISALIVGLTILNFYIVLALALFLRQNFPLFLIIFISQLVFSLLLGLASLRTFYFTKDGIMFENFFVSKKFLWEEMISIISYCYFDFGLWRYFVKTKRGNFSFYSPVSFLLSEEEENVKKFESYLVDRASLLKTERRFWHRPFSKKWTRKD